MLTTITQNWPPALVANHDLLCEVLAGPGGNRAGLIYASYQGGLDFYTRHTTDVPAYRFFHYKIPDVADYERY